MSQNTRVAPETTIDIKQELGEDDAAANNDERTLGRTVAAGSGSRRMAWAQAGVTGLSDSRDAASREVAELAPAAALTKTTPSPSSGASDDGANRYPPPAPPASSGAAHAMAPIATALSAARQWVSSRTKALGGSRRRPHGSAGAPHSSGGGGGGGKAGRRGIRILPRQQKAPLLRRVWNWMRDRQDSPGLVGWVLRRGLPALRAMVFVWDVVSDGLLAKDLFDNGYPRLGGLVVLFMLLHYLPTYLLMLRAANQAFLLQRTLLAAAAQGGGGGGAKAAASALPSGGGGAGGDVESGGGGGGSASASTATSSSLAGSLAVLEALHFLCYVLLAVFGLPLLPLLDAYMVLSATLLPVDSSEAGYVMRAADDFCRQYERIRLPLECVLESLPQTGVQVYLYYLTRSGSAASAVSVSQTLLLLSLLGSLANLANVLVDMYFAYKDSGGTVREYLRALLGLQGYTKVPIEVQRAVMDRVEAHRSRLQDFDKTAGAAESVAAGAGEGEAAEAAADGSGSMVKMQQDGGLDGGDGDHPIVVNLTAAAGLVQLLTRTGLPAGLQFALGGAHDTLYHTLSPFQRLILMDRLAEKKPIHDLRALCLVDMEPAVVERLIRKVTSLPPLLRIEAGSRAAAGGALWRRDVLHTVVSERLPEAALEVDPRWPLLDLILTALPLTGYLAAVGEGGTEAARKEARKASAAVGRALAEVALLQPHLRTLLLDRCDVGALELLAEMDSTLAAAAAGSSGPGSRALAFGGGSSWRRLGLPQHDDEAAVVGYGGAGRTPVLLAVVHRRGSPLQLEARLRFRARQRVTGGTSLHPGGGSSGGSGGASPPLPLLELHLVPDYPVGAAADPAAQVQLAPLPSTPGLLPALLPLLSAVMAPSSLNLSSSAFESLQADDVAALAACLAASQHVSPGRLQSLVLRSTGLGPERLELLLPGLRACTASLTALDLSYNQQLGGGDCEALVEVLEAMPKLRSLSLSKCGLDSEGAEAVASSLLSVRAYTRLQELSLQDNPLGASTPALEWLCLLFARTHPRAQEPKAPTTEHLEGFPLVPTFGLPKGVQKTCLAVLRHTAALMREAGGEGSAESGGPPAPTTRLEVAPREDLRHVVMAAAAALMAPAPLALCMVGDGVKRPRWFGADEPETTPLLSEVVSGLMWCAPPHLTELDLSRNDLASTGGPSASSLTPAGHLALGLGCCISLRRLALVGCGLDDAAALALCGAIASSPGLLRNLRRLELHGNPRVGDVGIREGLLPLLGAAVGSSSGSGSGGSGSGSGSGGSGMGLPLVTLGGNNSMDWTVLPKTWAAICTAARRGWQLEQLGPSAAASGGPFTSTAALQIVSGDDAADQAVESMLTATAGTQGSNHRWQQQSTAVVLGGEASSEDDSEAGGDSSDSEDSIEIDGREDTSEAGGGSEDSGGDAGSEDSIRSWQGGGSAMPSGGEDSPMDIALHLPDPSSALALALALLQSARPLSSLELSGPGVLYFKDLLDPSLMQSVFSSSLCRLSLRGTSLSSSRAPEQVSRLLTWLTEQALPCLAHLEELDLGFATPSAFPPTCDEVVEVPLPAAGVERLARALATRLPPLPPVTLQLSAEDKAQPARAPAMLEGEDLASSAARVLPCSGGAAVPCTLRLGPVQPSVSLLRAVGRLCSGGGGGSEAPYAGTAGEARRRRHWSCKLRSGSAVVDVLCGAAPEAEAQRTARPLPCVASASLGPPQVMALAWALTQQRWSPVALLLPDQSPPAKGEASVSSAEADVLLLACKAVVSRSGSGSDGLKTVRVRPEMLTDGDAAALALALMRGDNMASHTLELRHYRMSEEGMSALLQLIPLHAPTLRHLDLGGLPPESTGTAAPAEDAAGQPLTSLQQRLCGEVLPALAGGPLRSLDLRGWGLPLDALEPALEGHTSLKLLKGVDREAAAKAGGLLQRLCRRDLEVRPAKSDEEGALWEASHKGDAPEVLRLLEDPEVGVNAEVGDRTPLYIAARMGHAETVRALLEAGADTEAVDGLGRTALARAASEGETEAVRSLLEAGAKTEAADEDEETPLYAAARAGHTESVRALLEAGANIEAANKDGRTSLHAASLGGHTAVVEALLAAGARADVQDKLGYTPLYLAAGHRQPGTAQALLKAGARVNVANQAGSIPLHKAAVCGNTKVVKLLLQAGARMNTTNVEGNTPLHRAAEEGAEEAVQALLRAGARTDVTNKDGETPIGLVMEKRSRKRRTGTKSEVAKYSRIVKLLQQSGPGNKDAANKDGNTTRNGAAKRGQAGGAQALVQAAEGGEGSEEDEERPAGLTEGERTQSDTSEA